MHCLDPVLPVHGPARVQEHRGDVALQLGDAQAQRGHRQRAVTVQRAVPLELAQRRQAELVREVAPTVSVLVMLVLVQGQRVARVLVLVQLVIALHT